MERMSPLDATFLFLENENQAMHIGGVGVFEGPIPAQEEIVALIASKLHLVPRYRQKVKFLPLGAGLPGWIDDPSFQIGFHVRRTALPAPGGQAELDTLVSRLVTGQLDRSRPLWELWVIEGLADDQWALLSKIHHCMIDGASGADLMSVLFSLSPDEEVADPEPWEPGAEPGARRTLAEAARGALRPVGAAAQMLADQIRNPRELARKSVETVYGLARMTPAMVTFPTNPLNGTVGPHRRWTSTSATLADIKTVRAGLGGTVNDVVLAAITLGFQDLLRARGDLTPESKVRTMVPVSMRPPGKHESTDNQVSMLFVGLPVNLEGAEAILSDLRSQMDTFKTSGSPGAVDRIIRAGRFVPAPILAGAQMVSIALPQRTLNTVTTNVPGPRVPLYVAGRRLLHNAPWVPLGASMRQTVAIFSYNGVVTFGITGEYDATGDIDVLRDGIADGMATMIARSHEILTARADQATAAEPTDPGAPAKVDA